MALAVTRRAFRSLNNALASTCNGMWPELYSFYFYFVCFGWIDSIKIIVNFIAKLYLFNFWIIFYIFLENSLAELNGNYGIGRSYSSFESSIFQKVNTKFFIRFLGVIFLCIEAFICFIYSECWNSVVMSIPFFSLYFWLIVSFI